ncbi:immunoglobulin-like domain-containing protein [Peribacillus sp. NPDC097198]|uniref:immunoglobulin-like domain-containing protein n=1 Tax=Peribacillus sp. NPDC097198 TaxID=3364397 RepID=UPI003808ECB0
MKRVLTVKKDKIKPTISGVSNKIIQVGTSFDALKGIKTNDNIDGNLIKSIKVSGKVNTKSPGKYTLTYSVKDSSGNSINVKRIITVVDSTKPVINGINDVEIEVGKTFDKHTGVIATDNLDGIITNNIEVIGDVNTNNLGKYTLTYRIADKAGNITIKKRVVTVIDKSAPILNGVDDVSIDYGTIFDPMNGVFATDNVEGDVTAIVQIQGSVNTLKEGTQSIKYIVSDKSGNTTTKIRKITINEAPLVLFSTNQDYVSPDNKLTVNMASTNQKDEVGYYLYTINYTITNNTEDAIDEGSFKLYYEDGGSTPQYGFFNTLYPGESTTRSYSFKILKTQKVKCVEYGSDLFFRSKPAATSLKWK